MVDAKDRPLIEALTHDAAEFERAGQDFVVDVRLDLDLSRAAATDDVTETVHYGELAEKLVAVVAGPPVNLIETLAARLADLCLSGQGVSDPRVEWARVTVHKPDAPIDATYSDVALTITRKGGAPT